jgi:hypothetical protein
MIHTARTGTDEGPVIEPALSFERLPVPIMTIVVTWVLGLYVALILESPYWNDDIVDKGLRGMLKASHTTLGSLIWTQISAFVKIDGRFDPGTLAWTYSVFDVFDNRGSYKLVIGALLVLSVATVGLCVAAIAKSWAPAAALVLIASGFLQVRLWADGITSFAGLMTLTTALTFGALFLLLVRPGRWWALLAGALYLAALFTYEYVFVFAPVMIAIVVLYRKAWRPALALAGPAALTLLVAISLRLFTNPHPVPEYTISLVPGAVLSTFAKQMVAALPLSQWWIGDTPGLPPIAGTLILMCLVLIGVPVFWALRRLAENLALPRGRGVELCGLLGVWMWITPSILVATTKRWQTSMPWGQGYIPVVYEYFGLALCLLSLWLFISRRLHERGSARSVRAWSVGSAAALALLSAFTMAANLSLMP